MPLSKEQKQDQWRKHREEEEKQIEAWKVKLATKHKLERNAKFDKAWKIAWDRGHSNGFEEVEIYFDELAELLEGITAKLCPAVKQPRRIIVSETVNQPPTDNAPEDKALASLGVSPSLFYRIMAERIVAENEMMNLPPNQPAHDWHTGYIAALDWMRWEIAEMENGRD
jgi:hypothetical protein